MIPSEDWLPKTFRGEVGQEAQVAAKTLNVSRQLAVTIGQTFVELAEVARQQHFIEQEASLAFVCRHQHQLLRGAESLLKDIHDRGSHAIQAEAP